MLAILKDTAELGIQAFDGTFISSKVLSSVQKAEDKWDLVLEVTNSTATQKWNAEVSYLKPTEEYVVSALQADGGEPLNVNGE